MASRMAAESVVFISALSQPSPLNHCSRWQTFVYSWQPGLRLAAPSVGLPARRACKVYICRGWRTLLCPFHTCLSPLLDHVKSGTPTPETQGTPLTQLWPYYIKASCWCGDWAVSSSGHGWCSLSLCSQCLVQLLAHNMCSVTIWRTKNLNSAVGTVSSENYLAVSTRAKHTHALWLSWVNIPQKWACFCLSKEMHKTGKLIPNRTKLKAAQMSIHSGMGK